MTSPDWQRHDITGTVAEDADVIIFGGFLVGTGKAWFDDFQLLIRDGNGDEWTPVQLSNPGFEAAGSAEPPVGWAARAPGYRFTAADAESYEGERSLVIASSEAVQMARPVFDARPDAGEAVHRPLGSGLVAQIPLALFSKNGQTLRPEGLRRERHGHRRALRAR